jgi:hypothetical protein
LFRGWHAGTEWHLPLGAPVEAHLATRGKLPVNVVMIAEGEEEIGSDHLEEFVESKKDLLAAEAVVISDSAMFAPGQPSILSSLRGMAYFEINVTGPRSARCLRSSIFPRPCSKHVRGSRVSLSRRVCGSGCAAVRPRCGTTK